MSDAVAENTQSVLNTLLGMVGQTIGSGECYGLVAWYSQSLGGCRLGGGINSPNPNGNGRQEPGSVTARGMSASNIGGDYNWSAVGWTVKWDPAYSDLKAGAIINFAPTGSNPYGHTGVCTGQVGGAVGILDQNYAGRRYVTNRTEAWVPGNICSIIYPPDVAAGGSTSSPTTTPSPVSTGSGNTQVSVFETDYALIEVESQSGHVPKIYEVDNLHDTIYKQMQELMRDYSGNKNYILDKALVHSDLVEVELYDCFGGSYYIKPEYLPADGKKDKVMVSGVVSDSAYNHVTLLGYMGNMSKDTDVIQLSNTFRDSGEPLKTGLHQSTGRDLAILNDAEASWFLANKNQNAENQRQFKEQADMVKQNAELSKRRVEHASEVSMYNSKFAVDTAAINKNLGVVNSLINIGTNAFMGNVGGMASGVFGGLVNYYQADRAFDNARTNYGYQNTTNKLNEQSTLLANMQAKLGLEQSIRSYNASLADLANQPASIQQMGNDVSFYNITGTMDYYIAIRFAPQIIINAANQWIRSHGLTSPRFVDDVFKNLFKRRKYNFLKSNQLNLQNLAINQSHKNSLQAIFQSGCRVWEYSAIKDSDEIMFDIEVDNPDVE